MKTVSPRFFFQEWCRSRRYGPPSAGSGAEAAGRDAEWWRSEGGHRGACSCCSDSFLSCRQSRSARQSPASG